MTFLKRALITIAALFALTAPGAANQAAAANAAASVATGYKSCSSGYVAVRATVYQQGSIAVAGGGYGQITFTSGAGWHTDTLHTLTTAGSWRVEGYGIAGVTTSCWSPWF